MVMFHDEMCVKQAPIPELLKANKSMKQITVYLFKGLLEEFKRNAQVKVIVTYHCKICVNEPHTLDINFRTHGYEEADTHNPLHVL